MWFGELVGRLLSALKMGPRLNRRSRFVWSLWCVCRLMLGRRRRFLMRERVTRIGGAGRIDSSVSFLNVTNDAFFVDHKGGAISKPLLLVEDTIVLNYSAFEIAEDGEGYSELFCKLAIGRNAVYAHAEYLGVS